MATVQLTELAVRSLTSGLYFDTKTPSFGIRVGKHRKTWIVIKEPNRTKVSLGQYPVLSLAEARKKALIALGSPLVRSEAPTLTEALEEFLALDRWKPYSKYQLTRNIRNYFTSRKRLDKITHKEIAECVERIKAKSQAAHTLKDLKTFFNWAVPRYILHNPCSGLKGQRYHPRQRVLSEAELKILWKTEFGPTSPAQSLFRLLILTGARKGELAALSWVNVGEFLTFPETKSGRTHTIPCTPLMRAEIEKQPRTDFPYVFPGRTGKPFNGFHDPKTKLDRLIKSFVIHDIRRSFAHHWQRMGVPIQITEAALGHVGTRGGIVGVYQTYNYSEELKTRYAAWDAHLHTLTGS